MEGSLTTVTVSEKGYRKMSEILLKEDYEKVLEEVGEVRKISTNWNPIDMKKMSDTHCKKLLGISTMKRIFIKKEVIGKAKTKGVKVKMEENYRSNDEFTSIMKRGVKMNTVKITPLPITNRVKEEKLQNIKALLEKYDEEWENDEKFSFYRNLLARLENENQRNDQEEEVNEDNCECQEDCGV